MAPVAPHTVSPTSSKNTMGRFSAHGSCQRSSRKMAWVEQLSHRHVQHGRHLDGVGRGLRATGKGAYVRNDERAAGHRGEVIELPDQLDL